MSGRVPEEEAELRELIRDYRKAVASKPARQQETYGLSRLYGLTYEESGDVTGVSVHAVRSQIAGALRLLRKRLAEHL